MHDMSYTPRYPNSSPLKIGRALKGYLIFQTIHFQGHAASFKEGYMIMGQ